MLLGITGTDGAGKGTVVRYLTEQKGFVHYSARAIWEEEFLKRDMESSRANMRLVANELRAEHGNDFVVAYYLKKFTAEKPANAVIESIRALAEVETLQQAGGYLLAVDADQHIRYDRIVKRGSGSDHVSFEEFAAHEQLEMNDPDPHGMQKAAVMAAADHTTMNNGSIAAAEADVAAWLQSLAH